MPEAMQRLHGLESFLESRSPTRSGESGVTAEVLGELSYLNLRGNALDPELVEKIEESLGQDLPIQPNTASISNHKVCWLGPDEWMIESDTADGAKLTDRLNAAIDGMHAAVNDLSGSLVTIRLSGDKVTTLLSKGCTLDFHADVFKPGDCAQSGLAKANVLIRRADAADIFDVVVRRSFAEYLALWLERAAGDSGIEFR